MGLFAATGPDRTAAQTTGVTWTRLVNAAATGSTLQKNAGCDGCDDAGGSSEQSLGRRRCVPHRHRRRARAVQHGNRSALSTSSYACGSNASRVADMADEIVCFPLDAARNADGSLDVLVVGQVMTDLTAAGGQDHDNDDYEQLPKGNVDVSGRYFIWTTNLVGDRLDAFLVQIPGERLYNPPLPTLGRRWSCYPTPSVPFSAARAAIDRFSPSVQTHPCTTPSP